MQLWAFLFLVVLVGAVQIPLHLDLDVGRDEPATDFSLRHIYHHGTNKYNKLHRRLDVRQQPHILSLFRSYTLPKSLLSSVVRLKDRSRHGIRSYQEASMSDTLHTRQIEWTQDRLRIPNITDRNTVVSLAKIANDAYIKIPRTEDWLELNSLWNVTNDFGWEENGIRGHVFANKNNNSVIIGLKGTSPPSYSSGTGANDKSNDNLLFSCCCGRVSWIWPTVCDCYIGTYTCNATCLENELLDTSHYYQAAVDVYYNVSALYPHADIWLIGHSLGGALASLVGQTFGLPTVTFEAPGEKLASRRLHLPTLHNTTYSARNGSESNVTHAPHLWHFGHTADPIFMGTCNGPTSACWLARYAMETHCHAGLSCVYDTVTDKGWRQYIGTHRIMSVIDDVILTYNETANCVRTDECIDCFSWNFE